MLCYLKYKTNSPKAILSVKRTFFLSSRKFALIQDRVEAAADCFHWLWSLLELAEQEVLWWWELVLLLWWADTKVSLLCVMLKCVSCRHLKIRRWKETNSFQIALLFGFLHYYCYFCALSWVVLQSAWIKSWIWLQMLPSNFSCG